MISDLLLMAKFFEVEKKAFQVKFEGSNGGTWISIIERSQGFVVGAFEESCGVGGFQGFYLKD